MSLKWDRDDFNEVSMSLKRHQCKNPTYQDLLGDLQDVWTLVQMARAETDEDRRQNLGMEAHPRLVWVSDCLVKLPTPDDFSDDFILHTKCNMKIHRMAGILKNEIFKFNDRTPQKPVKDIPVTLQLDPITSLKRAYLTSDLTKFRAIRWPFTYGVTDKAFCPYEEHEEPVPAVDCSCGFYLAKDNNITSLTGGDGNVTLKVEAYGRILRHERGWRVSHQRVLQVILDRQCKVCLVGTANLWAPNTGPVCGLCSNYFSMSPSLMDHAVPLAEIANRLQTEVVWSEQ